jgi:hypothetical protein
MQVIGTYLIKFQPQNSSGRALQATDHFQIEASDPEQN